MLLRIYLFSEERHQYLTIAFYPKCEVLAETNKLAKDLFIALLGTLR